MHDPNCEFTRKAYFRKHYTGMINMQGQMQRALRENDGSPQRVEAPEQTWMPSIELSALKAIDEREECLLKLYHVLGRDIDQSDQRAVDELRSELADLLAALRLAGVAVCETISRWRKRRGGAE
eukprot:6147737-Prymnesium_polylepis.1